MRKLQPEGGYVPIDAEHPLYVKEALPWTTILQGGGGVALQASASWGNVVASPTLPWQPVLGSTV